jgi:gamma-glutamyltranspeptidase/glutathione hydrolase
VIRRAAAIVFACIPVGLHAQSLDEAATAIAPKRLVTAQRFMAVAAHPLAAKAGYEILKRGGSAVDAAIATELVLNLVEPQSSGIGGGGFLLYYDAKEKKLAAFDGRETAPAAAKPDRFLDAAGHPLARADAVISGRSVGVPGLLRMLELAHRRHGKLAWAELFAPAIELAEGGFPVSPRLHALIERDRFLRGDGNARLYFYQPDGSA